MPMLTMSMAVVRSPEPPSHGHLSAHSHVARRARSSRSAISPTCSGGWGRAGRRHASRGHSRPIRATSGSIHDAATGTV